MLKRACIFCGILRTKNALGPIRWCNVLPACQHKCPYFCVPCTRHQHVQ